ncbi:MAG: hypothetical protein NC095_11540 [Muribaculum sp.]|nr:hypothetical protein [Muribaculum sp.]
MEIWDMLWPDGSPISPDSSKGTLVFYDDTKARNRVNRYREIINSDSDTLYIFLCTRWDAAPYCAYGWTASGDTLMLGDSQFMSSNRSDIEQSPIMEFVLNWNIDSISFFWPYVGHELPWDSFLYWPDYVFRIVYTPDVTIEGAEICFWKGKESTYEEVRALLSPMLDDDYQKKTFLKPTVEITLDLIINDDAP